MLEALSQIFKERRFQEPPFVRSLGLEFLNSLEEPAILHFGHSYQAEGTSHWVLFMGTNDHGEYRILDLPRDESSVDGPLLLSYWNGAAILASRNESSLSFQVYVNRISQIVNYVLYIAAPFVFACFDFESCVERNNENPNRISVENC